MNAACPKPSKQRYATPEGARQAAAGLVLVAEGLVMRAYLCPCGWWHLTRRQSFPLAWHDTPGRTA